MSDALPRFLADRLAEITAGHDLTDPVAVRSRCEDWSRAVVAALHKLRLVEVDEDGDEVEIDRAKAWWAFRWEEAEVPLEVVGNPLAVGHVVAFVKTDEGTWMIDLTAAQFPVLGWVGPIVERIM